MPCEPESRCSFATYPRVSSDDKFTHVIFSQVVYSSGRSDYRCGALHMKLPEASVRGCTHCQKGIMADKFKKSQVCPAAVCVYLLPVCQDGVKESGGSGMRYVQYDGTDRSSWSFEMSVIMYVLGTVPDDSRVLVLSGVKLWDHAEVGSRYPSVFTGVPDFVEQAAMRFDRLVFDVVIGSQCKYQCRQFAYSAFEKRKPTKIQSWTASRECFVINSNGRYKGYNGKIIDVGVLNPVVKKRVIEFDESSKVVKRARVEQFKNHAHEVLDAADDEEAETLMDQLEENFFDYFGYRGLSFEQACDCRDMYRKATERVMFRDPVYQSMLNLMAIAFPSEAADVGLPFKGFTQKVILDFMESRSDLDVKLVLKTMLPILSVD